MAATEPKLKMISQNFTRACEVITQRHRTGAFASLECFLCGSKVTGYKTLQMHIAETHGVELPSFDDIEFVDEMLVELGKMCHSSSTIICPATQLTFDSLGSFEEAVKTNSGSTDLGRWTWDTVPLLRRYRVICQDTEAGEDSDDEGYEDIADHTDGCFIDKIECPYCCLGSSSGEHSLFSSSLFKSHMTSFHGIDNFVTLLNAFRKEDGTKLSTQYDKIRLINMIREATDDNRIPQSGESVGEGTSICKKLKELHMIASSNGTPELSPYIISAEGFSKLVSDEREADKYLIPKRPNDPLITFCMQGDNTDDEWSDDDGADQFPMVPTLGEAIEKRNQRTRQFN